METSNKNNFLKESIFIAAAIITIILGYDHFYPIKKTEKVKQDDNSVIQYTVNENQNNPISNKEKPEIVNNNNTIPVNNPIEQTTIKEQNQESNNNIAPATVNIKQEPQIPDCEKNNTGDYCFTNNTNVEIQVVLIKESSGSAPSVYPNYWDIDKTMLIQPKKSQCFYDITANARSYGVYGQVYTNNSWIIISGAQIKVNKCKSETISVDGTYKHYIGY